jgi:methylated-DNA-[protein]-cysteine S-methyltransferase
MTTESRWTIYESPLGPLTLTCGPRGLTGLRFPGRGDPLDDGDREPARFAAAVRQLDEGDRDPARFAAALRQLDEYFTGRREGFGLTLDLGGTPFQRSVWDELLRIPCGSTTTYGALARAVGRPDAVRAVAAAVGRTPLPIIVPCHRVVARDGALTGYVGGLERKQALLDLERRAAAGPVPGFSLRQLALL